jgi:hypothetical protein
LVEIGEGFAEFAEGDEAEEESAGGEDREEVAKDKDELGALGPVHPGGYLEDGGGEDPGEAECEDGDKEVQKEAFNAPISGLHHYQDVAQQHLVWCVFVDRSWARGLILQLWRGPTDLERQRVR